MIQEINKISQESDKNTTNWNKYVRWKIAFISIFIFIFPVSVFFDFNKYL